MFLTLLVATSTKLNLEIDVSKSRCLDYLKVIYLSIVILRSGITLFRCQRFVQMRNY